MKNRVKVATFQTRAKISAGKDFFCVGFLVQFGHFKRRNQHGVAAN